jgi:hypothetical protein
MVRDTACRSSAQQPSGYRTKSGETCQLRTRVVCLEPKLPSWDARGAGGAREREI